MLAPCPAPGQAESTLLFLSLGEVGIALGADVDFVLLVVPARPQPGILFCFESGKQMNIDKDNDPPCDFPGSVSVPSQPFFGPRCSPSCLVFITLTSPSPGLWQPPCPLARPASLFHPSYPKLCVSLGAFPAGGNQCRDPFSYF